MRTSCRCSGAVGWLGKEAVSRMTDSAITDFFFFLSLRLCESVFLVKKSRRRHLCGANKLSRLLTSLMAVTKEPATSPLIHQTTTLDLVPLAACTVHSLLQVGFFYKH